MCVYACVRACTCVTGVSSFILISVLGICRLCSACQVPRAWMSAPASCVTSKQSLQYCSGIVHRHWELRSRRSTMNMPSGAQWLRSERNTVNKLHSDYFSTSERPLTWYMYSQNMAGKYCELYIKYTEICRISKCNRSASLIFTSIWYLSAIDLHETAPQCDAPNKWPINCHKEED